MDLAIDCPRLVFPTPGGPTRHRIGALAVGFNFKWVASAGQFSHPAAIVICSPDGKVSQYLYGVRFDPKVIQQALADARARKIVESVERFVMTCLQYDGKQGKHS